VSAAKKRGPGRPRLPKGEARGAVLSVRLTTEERRVAEAAARAAGLSASDWARATLVAEAIPPHS